VTLRGFILELIPDRARMDYNRCMENLTKNRLIDTFGRVHRSLRISVTDRCNIRCFYCMPLENIQFSPRQELLTYEEIERFVVVCTGFGIHKLRITGGEPLVRSDVSSLIARLKKISGISEIALTTNAILLANQVDALRAAGLDRLNVSLDALSEEKFERITRRKGVEKVLGGIEAAKRCGFENIKMNAVSIRGLTESEIVPLAEFARQQSLHLRFIEFMPLDADQNWEESQVLTGSQVREILSREIMPLTPCQQVDPNQPAIDYRYRDGSQKVGFINSVSEPFCGACDRLRVTAEGQIRNCLFSTTEWDARRIMREGGSDEQLRELLIDCVRNKKQSHGTDSPEFARPQRAMYQIGG